MTEFQEKVLKLIKEGKSPSEIKRLLNCPRTSIASVLKTYNVPIEKRNYLHKKCKEDYFDIIDTDEKAYILGFFIADGTIDSFTNRMGISIQSSDKEVLDLIKFELNISNNIIISNRHPELRKEQAQLRWSSKHMVNTLKEYNILPRKTYDSEFIFPFDKIPEQFYRSFIRGFIDGDGSYEFNGKGTFTIRLVSTSKSFLDQIGNIVSSNIEGIGYCLEYHKGKTIDWYTLRFQTYGIDKPNKILKLYKFLYQDSKFSFKRKKDKMESYLKYLGKLEN